MTVLLYDIEILAVKLIQILNLDLGVLLWLSFQIILSGHAIITNNTREEGKEHVNLDYTLIRIFVVFVFHVFGIYCFIWKMFLCSLLSLSYYDQQHFNNSIDARVSKVYPGAGNRESAFYVMCNMNFTFKPGGSIINQIVERGG